MINVPATANMSTLLVLQISFYSRAKQSSQLISALFYLIGYLYYLLGGRMYLLRVLVGKEMRTMRTDSSDVENMLSIEY